MKRILQILNHAGVVRNLVFRNIKIKYKGTWLGVFWVFLQPLCTIAILYFVFSRVFKTDIEQFPMFLCAGVLPWSFFAASLIEGSSALVHNGNLVLKVNFPLELLPFSYCLSNVFDFCFALIVFIPLAVYFGSPFNIILFMALVNIIILHVLFVFGLTLFLSVAHVFFKDVGHILSIVLMFWFYLTPIFYTIDHLAEEIINLYQFNPMLHFINSYRDVLLNGSLPSFYEYGVMIILACASLIGGWLFFLIKERTVVKEI